MTCVARYGQLSVRNTYGECLRPQNTHLTDGQSQLPGRDDGTTNGGRRNLGQVHGHTVRDDTDTDTEDQSTNDEERDRSDEDELKDTSDGDDQDGGPKSSLSSKIVTQDRSHQGSDKLSGLDDRGEDGGVG